MSQQKGALLPKDTIVPNHIAIILDGNRRWARARGLHPSEGHKAGYKAMKRVVQASREIGVHTLTVWGFSTENWDRAEEETMNIMNLVRKFLLEFEKEAKKDKVRFVHLGRRDRLPKDIVEAISSLEESTKKYNKYILNVALDYGGRDEIVRAVRTIVDKGIPSAEITEDLISSYMDTKDQPYPNPDLFIRPSGEQRTSGLMPWQMTYAEFYWERDHLPDITQKKFLDIIKDYSRRRRRFGGNDEVTHLKFKPEVTARLEVGWWRLANIPEGTRFRDYARQHLRELYGLSTTHAKEAAHHMVEAIRYGEKKNWSKAQSSLKLFYILLKDELKLAFEPSIVASLELKLWQTMKSKNADLGGQFELDIREYLAEMYRISDFQAAKAAHLRVLATTERRLAEVDNDEYHWERAKDYLELYYKALKDRIA